MKKSFLIFSFIFSCGYGFSQGIIQQVYASSGAYASNANFSLSYTIGEAITSTLTGGSYFLTQGFQQPNYNVTLVEDYAAGANLIVYPNPVDDFINIDLGSFNSEKYRYELYDITGKLMQNGNITDKITKLDMTPYASDIYFIRLSLDNKLIKNFKVQKIN